MIIKWSQITILICNNHADTNTLNVTNDIQALKRQLSQISHLSWPCKLLKPLLRQSKPHHFQSLSALIKLPPLEPRAPNQVAGPVCVFVWGAFSNVMRFPVTGSLPPVSRKSMCLCRGSSLLMSSTCVCCYYASCTEHDKCVSGTLESLTFIYFSLHSSRCMLGGCIHEEY